LVHTKIFNHLNADYQGKGVMIFRLSDSIVGDLTTPYP